MIVSDKFKDVRVQFTFKFEGGGSTKGDYRSNSPLARVPATPEKTLADVVEHFVYMATALGTDAQVMDAASNAFQRANDYRMKQGQAPVVSYTGTDAAVAIIQFILGGEGSFMDDDDEKVDLLRRWNEGDFDYIRRNYPEAPEAIYIGADPLYKPKVADGPQVDEAGHAEAGPATPDQSGS